MKPLGSAKKKNTKVLQSIFLWLPAHVRSSTDHMSLILLCGENDLKLFGITKVFSEMLVDLKHLEETRIPTGGETIKGSLH